MHTEYLFQNVNLDSISFINNKNDIKFVFISSYNGNYYGCLSCINLISFKMNTDMDEDKYFPKFVLDVTCEKQIKENFSNYYVKFEGGEYYIEIICETIKIEK